MKCFKKIIFTLSYFLLLMNIITLKAGKNHKIKLGNANKHKIRGTQPPYMTVTVDPYKVEADDVGFRRIDVPVMRRSNIHSGVVDGMLDLSHTFQSPNNIHAAQGINLHQRQYLPYSNYYDPTHVMHGNHLN